MLVAISQTRFKANDFPDLNLWKMRSLHEGNIQDRMNFRLWISYGMRFEVECF